MYNQKEYIYNEFVNNYREKSVPIVIYGIGINTGELLDRVKDYNIVGLLDGKIKSGEAWGKRIIDLPEMIEKGYKTIVVVSRPAVIGIIYHRIEKFVKQNDIFVGDVKGRNLAEIYKNRGLDNPYFSVSWSDLERECDCHSIISFDIFDTLLVRQVLYPKDIFDVVQKSMKSSNEIISEFVDLRISSENELYKEGINPTIYQIYDRIQEKVKCSDYLKNKYLNQEIDTEKKFIKPRKSMLSFFNKIKDKKKIYLISDMYLPSDILKEILSECGYKGYEKIVVSCEYNCSKTGGLYKLFISEDSSIKKCLHIGDNYEADIISAKNAGLDAFFIMSEIELLENSSYSGLVAIANSLLDNIAVGLFCNRAFDDPFVMYGTKGIYAIKNHRDLSYLICSAEILYFSCWLIKSIINSECDYVIYPSRDAYILEQICKNIVDIQKIDDYVDGKYIYVSRRTMNAATLFNINDINNVSSHEYNGSIEQMYKKRFNIIVSEHRMCDKKLLMNLNKKYEKEILNEGRIERENYVAYIKNEIPIQVRNVAFIDFIAAGTVQNGLRKIVDSFKIHGFYFMKRNTDDVDKESSINVSSFYNPKGDFEIDDNIYKYYLFFELLLTSPESTLNYINDDLQPVFLEETRNEDEIKVIMEMQDEMLEYAKQISILHPDLLNEKIEKNVPDAMVGFLGQEYSDIRCEMIKSMELLDEYLSKSFNIFGR